MVGGSELLGWSSPETSRFLIYSIVKRFGGFVTFLSSYLFIDGLFKKKKKIKFLVFLFLFFQTLMQHNQFLHKMRFTIYLFSVIYFNFYCIRNLKFFIESSQHFMIINKKLIEI